MSCGGARSPPLRGWAGASSPTRDWSSSATACSGSQSPRSSIAVPRTSTRAGSRRRPPTAPPAPRAPPPPAPRPPGARVGRTLGVADECERERERRGAEARIELSRNVLAALCESVIGAAFLHYGYRETAGAGIEAFRERIEYAEQGFVDHKTELQERLARQGASVSYRLMEATGPAHRRSFTSAALLDEQVIGTGEGPSKKSSEQAAAQEALLRVDGEGRLCT